MKRMGITFTFVEPDCTPEELEAAVEDYRVLLYNHVFDKKNRVEGFFTLTE